MPEPDASVEAESLVQRMPELWSAADLAVYVDAWEARAVVSIRPKAAFESAEHTRTDPVLERLLLR